MSGASDVGLLASLGEQAASLIPTSIRQAGSLPAESAKLADI